MDAIEAYKENIKPLRRGRKVESLQKVIKRPLQPHLDPEVDRVRKWVTFENTNN
jgi:hypothetical protein